ncbi:MAG: hypothetical protein IKQ29_00780 [Bacilli bacterium]|nr:hypothetical protein [Bacilli bacterium]
MSDTNLYVNITELGNDGDLLVDKSTSINENIDSINSLISREWNSWLGTDSDEYVNSLKKFIQLLSQYSSELNKLGIFMKNVSNDYLTSVNTCIKELNSNE